MSRSFSKRPRPDSCGRQLSLILELQLFTLKRSQIMKRISSLISVASIILISGCNNSIQQSNDVANQVDTELKTEADPQDTPDGNSKSESSTIVYGDKYPEVLAVKVSQVSGENWRFNVTLSSTYDSPERYADAWRVLDGNGNELGIRELGHDHAGEQPFTRSTTVQIPNGITTVNVEGRDQANGWSGQRFEVELKLP